MNRVKSVISKIFIIYVFILVSCSDNNDDSVNEIKLLNVGPVSSSDSFPVETKEQLNVEFAANVSQNSLTDELVSSWQIEKIKPDVLDVSLETSAENIMAANEKNDGFFMEISEDGLKALVAFYERGSYRITYTVTNYSDTKSSEFIIKNGEPECRDLYVALNIPAERSDATTDYKGIFAIQTQSSDGTSDSISINLDALRDSWYDTGLQIDPLRSFDLRAGILINSDETNKTVILSLPQLLQLQRGSENALLSNEPIDIETDIVSLVQVDEKQLFSSALYASNQYWWNDGTQERYGFRDSMFYQADLPFQVVSTEGAYLAKLFVGNIGIKPENSSAFIYFSLEGVRSSSVDPRNKRPYSGLPYGYLIGKIGAEGTVFPIGYAYSSQASNDLPVYSYDGKNFTKSR